MPLKDMLKRRSKLKDEEKPATECATPPAEFTFMRTDTNTQEIISPPYFDDDDDDKPGLPVDSTTNSESRRSSKHFPTFRRSSNASTTPKPSNQGERRLSQRLHFRSASRTSSFGSVIVPTDLPDIENINEAGEDKEAEWEKRATILATGNPIAKPGATPTKPPTTAAVEAQLLENGSQGNRPDMNRSISDARGDENIQEAIRLHEAGDLTRSTAMFGRLADPDGANNALSQVLYGLALRHGWGIPPDPSLAITYLSLAASNSAAVESQALSSGIKKGGAAKGELVLAIYELAQCFRHGWGVQKDPVAARSYYETAANLGDTDAMNEAAWCYEQGFGGKKDKFTAARYLRLAEKNGNKTIGNSWIWKSKYSGTDT